MAYSKQTWDTTSYVNPTRMNHIENGIESASTAEGTDYSAGVSVKDKIDEVEGEIPEIADNLTTDDSTKALSAKQGKVLNEKFPIYRIQSATFSNGQATVTHNFGKANKIIPLPYGSLVPITAINMDANSFTLKVAFISDSNVADSKVATNYTGTFDVQYFIVPT